MNRLELQSSTRRRHFSASGYSDQMNGNVSLFQPAEVTWLAWCASSAVNGRRYYAPTSEVAITLRGATKTSRATMRSWTWVPSSMSEPTSLRTSTRNERSST